MGTPVAVRHAVLGVALRPRRTWPDHAHACQAPSQALPRPAAVSWSHPQAPLYGLCAGGAGISGSATSPPTAADHFQPGTATPGGHLAALLPQSGLRLSRLGGLGQSQCEGASERRPVATAVLQP